MDSQLKQPEPIQAPVNVSDHLFYHGTLVRMVFLFSLIGAIVVGIKMYLNKTGQSAVINTQAISPTPSIPTQNTQPSLTIIEPTATEDPTLDWNTWQNQDIALTFKYPKEWKYYEDSGAVGYDDGEYGYSVNIGFVSNNVPLEDFVNSIGTNNTAQKSRIFVGEREGLLITSEKSNTIYTTIYVVFDPQTALEINASGTYQIDDIDSKNRNAEILTHILASFRYN